MRKSRRSLRGVLAVASFAIGAAGSACGDDRPLEGGTEQTTSEESLLVLPSVAHVVASGIPGAGAIAQIGPFHRGGPVHDRADFSAFAEPGHVLNGERLLVASTSNFGAPLARPSEAPGSILSIDPNHGSLAVPASFASGGGQAAALGGAVQIYTSQSPAFLNSVNNPGAVTADLPAVSLPLGISVNNGFGRPWFANGPAGAGGYGTITVIDPNGTPLVGPPSPVAGGVFAGDLTNRSPATTHGLSKAALATALLTKSPDGTGKAVFLAAQADGSVVQVHVQLGLDGLAPPGSFTPLTDVSVAAAESNNAHKVTRVGIAFNWVPAGQKFGVFVTDPLADRIMVLELHDDGVLLTANPPHYLHSSAFDTPVDIASTVPEFVAGNFASATTMGAGSDLYVLNRGNNTVVRIRQSGQLVGVRAIIPNVPIPGMRVAGIAVSPDAQTIWITATAPGRKGYVLSMSAFGEGLITASMLAHAKHAGAGDMTSFGVDIFSTDLHPLQLLGPLFNGRSCADCHSDPFAGGMSPLASSETKVARSINGHFDPLLGHGGPVARSQSIRDLGFPCSLPTGVPPQANVVSPRLAMTLRGTALIDNIDDEVIIATQAAEPPAVRGRINFQPDGRLGRFGWKAQTPTLVEFMGDAFRTELGVTNPLQPEDFVNGCGAGLLGPEIDAVPVQAVTAFMDTLDPPAPSAACLSSAGAATFSAIGCADCHKTSMPSEGIQAWLFSDLLLHDMGPGLADGYLEVQAGGSEFRTMPLWRAADRSHFLHDGRASTIEAAITAHGGQAGPARAAFVGLSATDRQALLDFLGCI